MNINCDYDELEMIGNNSKKNATDLSAEFEKWEKGIEQLKRIWQGQDAEIFFTKLTSYLIKLKMLSVTFDAFGTLMEKSVNTYYQEEEEWTHTVKSNRESLYAEKEFYVEEFKL